MLPYVWSDLHARHVPGGEVYVGVHTPGTEVPERADRIKQALDAAGAHRVDARAHSNEEALALHDPDMVSWLRSAWRNWQDVPSDRVVPYLFPTPGLIGDLPLREPASVAAGAGRWVYDTMTLIGPGTWEAARAAVDAALTAADIVLAGEPFAYAVTRPPGHHVTRGGMGGSCYLNNSAAAAAHLHRALKRPVALVDIDAHHGNGAQSIFHGDASVLTGSVHVDPARGWFPHYLGHASESHASNRNLPLEPGTGNRGWLAAVDELVAFAFPVSAVVIALGVDAAGGDPEAPLEVTIDGYREAGRRLGRLDVPIVVVQEGGYDLATIGPLVTAFLAGLVLS